MERRNRRSTHPLKAAAFYLDALASRRLHSAVALADSDGLLLAGSETNLDTEAIAAIAPLAKGSPAQDGLLDLVTRGQRVHIWPVEVYGGESLYVAAVGGPTSPPGDLHASMSRILN